MGGHKLIVYPAAHKALLFDLSADPLEMHPIANPSLESDLLAALQSLQSSLDDPLDLSNLIPVN
ncbi:hypothetical protein BH23VER1_BH23VER1_17100 [soil metagenome]